jgi:hypothetical protein
VTLRDIARFRPAPAVTGMEPNGWAVVGLHVNFFAAAATETQDGSLLGRPAQVRFTPASYTWDYGDGATRAVSDGGARWRQLSLPDFSPTATSHVYAVSGDFAVRLTVAYTAEYRFAGAPWRAIPGRLDVPIDPLTVAARSAKTVLVDEDCIANPRGPGC